MTVKVIQRHARCWAIHNQHGYALNSRTTLRGAVAMAARHFPSEIIEVFSRLPDGALQLIETLRPVGLPHED